MRLSKVLVVYISLGILCACSQPFTPEQVVLAKEYCKTNGMVYQVRTESGYGRYGNDTRDVRGCVDTDGQLYNIPQEKLK